MILGPNEIGRMAEKIDIGFEFKRCLCFFRSGFKDDTPRVCENACAGPEFCQETWLAFSVILVSSKPHIF